MFENLKAEMGRKDVTMLDISKNPKMNLSYESVRNKFFGKTEWTRKEMFIIQEDFFPDKTLEYLFNQQTSNRKS